MLRVAGFVEERTPVVRAALRLDHEDDAVRNLDRDAECARRLVRAVLEIELDVALRAQVDAELGERRLERRHHAVLRKRLVPAGAAKHARDVPALDLAESEADPRAEEAIARVLPEPLRRVEEPPALVGEIVEGVLEAAIELGVVRRAEPLRLAVDDLVLADVQVVVLLRRLVARVLERLAALAVVLVRDAGAQVAVRDLLVPDLDRVRLGLGDLLLLLADEVAEVPLARKAPKLADVAAAVHRRADVERGVELGQLGVALVDRDEVVGLLVAREVEIRLLVQLRDEAVSVVAEGVELSLAERRGHGVPRISPCRRSTSRPTARPSF